MSLFILLYLFIIFFFLFSGIFVFLKYKKSSGIFFILSSIFFAFWALFYIYIFNSNIDKELLLYIFRIMYSLSFLGMYNMLLFINYFGKKIDKKLFYSNIFFYISIFILFIFTPLFLKDLNYIPDKNYYFEEYGVLYNIVLVFYILFTPLFLFTYFRVKKQLSYINSIRLKFITLGFAFFMFLSIIFYVILPFFGKYYFEDSAILFSLPFIFSILYSSSSYHFSDIKIGFGKFFISALSLFYSILLINVIKYYYINLGENFSSFWGINKDFGTLDIVVGILLFLLFYNLFNKVFLGNTSIVIFEKKINNLKKYIPYISSIDELNNFLNKRANNLFKIKNLEIQLYGDSDKNLELYKYFSKDKSRESFINDIVFIEENKYKIDVDKLKIELDENIYLVFPMIDNKGNLLGIFKLSKKPFNDNYHTEEIEILKHFIDYISSHLKYIEIYSKINDLNINLDKKIDEKTIEYNDLINKQKEFISLISHEIKTPLSTSIFQVDSLIDDLDDGEKDITKIKNELNLIEKQLIKISELTNNLFTQQRYDLGKVHLMKENLNIEDLLSLEIETFGKKYNNLKLNLNFNLEQNEYLIDKIQFIQVITNLLVNAYKFANPLNKKIEVSLYDDKDYLYIDLEDNGKGFGDIDTSLIFEKYNTGNKTTVGIGMGLYLCDKIINMHGGKIYAMNSKKLGGAKFSIKLKKVI